MCVCLCVVDCDDFCVGCFVEWSGVLVVVLVGCWEFGCDYVCL